MSAVAPYCCRLSGLRVRSLKSLRDLELRLQGNPVLVLGPNGSGKTAVIDSLFLLVSFLDYLRGRRVNPFLRWWGFENLVWRHDSNLPIEVGITLDCSGCTMGVPGLGKVGELSYELAISGAGGVVRILREIVRVEGYGSVTHEGSRLRVELNRGGLRESIGDVVRRSLDILIPSAAASTGSTATGKCIDTSDEKIVEGIIDGVLEAFSELSIDASITSRSLLDIYVYQRLNREYGLNQEVFINAYRPIIEREVWKASYDKTGKVKEVLKQYNECKDLGEGVLEAAAMMLVNNLSSHIVDKAFNLILRPSLLLGEYIERITIIGMIDYQAIKTPEPSFEPADKLREDASNLKKLLFVLGQGRLPSEVTAVLARVLGAEKVEGFFELTGDGRITLRLVVDELTLPPPLIPDGAWKAMAVVAAALNKSTLVAVDGFEDGLFLRAQKAVAEVLSKTVASSLLATHSAAGLSFVEDPRQVVVLWKEKGETRAAIYDSQEDLLAKLEELGLMARIRGEEEQSEPRGEEGKREGASARGEEREKERVEERRKRRFRFFR